MLQSLLLSLFLGACGSPKQVAQQSSKPPARHGVEFFQSDTFFAVLDKAAAENKLVFVDFYTSWCTPCKMMDEDVFTDAQVARFMNKNFVNFKVEGDKELGQKIGGLYSVRAYPTLIFMNAKGVELERKDGAAYQTQLTDLAMNALAKAGYAAR